MVIEGERENFVFGKNEGDWWGFVSGKWDPGPMMLASITV